MKDNDIPTAASLYVGHCGCPSIHIVLVDKHGKEFATAVMSLDMAQNVARDVLENVPEARRKMAAKKTGAIGDCEGHA